MYYCCNAILPTLITHTHTHTHTCEVCSKLIRWECSELLGILSGTQWDGEKCDIPAGWTGWTGLTDGRTISFLSFSQFVLVWDLLDIHWNYCPEQTKMDYCGLKEIFFKIHNSANKLLTSALVLFTDLTAGILGHLLFRRHFHCLLSLLVLFGPVLSLWVSKYSIFANKNHYLYRQDLS